MQLNVATRNQLGKKTKKVRQDRKIPGVIFGPEIESIPVSLEYTDFVHTFREAGETTVIDIVVDAKKKTYPVLVKDVQFHPVNYEILHVSFYMVNLKEKTTASIPVEIVGEETIELVKNREALVLTPLNEIPVEALPTDLPHQFTIDVSGLAEIGDNLTIADLDFDREKVTILDHEEDDIVAALDYATIEEEEEEEVLTEEDLIEGLEATEETAEDAEESAEETEEPEASEEE